MQERALDQKDAEGVDLPQALTLRLRKARSVAVLTGAGVSAESGIPTFRDAQTGLWARYDPLQLATPEAFARDPALVWKWYAWRRELVGSARPNAGHRALATLETRVPDFLLITQNVDGLHRKAGSRKMVALHGELERTVCSRERTVVADLPADSGSPPLCPACGSPLRPDVVWFGESLPAEALAMAEAAAARAELFVSVGTSGEVYPAAALPAIARAGGAAVIEINPQPTPLSASADYRLRAPAAIALPALLRAAFPDID
jgi:NAD-dependent deacetylase